MPALVLLADHLHALWTLPPEDHGYSARWSVIKKSSTARFLAPGGLDSMVSAGKQRERRRSVWQRRFWEHTIRADDDFETHLDGIHYKPVKHQLVNYPGDWGPSRFHRRVEAGVDPANWACGGCPPPKFPATEDEYGEGL